jgi:hypothetical protein
MNRLRLTKMRERAYGAACPAAIRRISLCGWRQRPLTTHIRGVLASLAHVLRLWAVAASFLGAGRSSESTSELQSVASREIGRMQSLWKRRIDPTLTPRLAQSLSRRWLSGIKGDGRALRMGWLGVRTEFRNCKPGPAAREK